MSLNKLKLNSNDLNFCIFVDSTFSHFHIIQTYYLYLEKLINSNGGIGYKKISIHLQDQIELEKNKQTIYEFITNNDFQFVLHNGEQPHNKFDISTVPQNFEQSECVVFFGHGRDACNRYFNYCKYVYSTETFSSAGGYEGISKLFPEYTITAAVDESKKDMEERFRKENINPIFCTKDNFKDLLTKYFDEQTDKDMFYASALFYPENFSELDSDEVGNWAERGDYLLDLFFKHGDGEFFDGGGVFYETAQERLTVKENKENKSVHCYAPLDYLVYMRSQDILKTFDKSLSSWKLSKIDSRLFPSSVISLLQDIFKETNLNNFNFSEMLDQAVLGINRVDGKSDIHRGDFGNLAFKNYDMAQTGKYTLDLSLAKDGKTVKERMSRYQKLDWDQKIIDTIKPVTYTYFDIVNIRNISIEEGTFKAQFFLDITSKILDPIKILSFNNLDLDESMKVKIVKQDELEGNFHFYRYLIDAKFDFFPVVDNYPFDKQLAFISFAIMDEDRHGILQPLPVEELDREFRLEGWHITDTRSGVFRRKVNFNTFLGSESMIKIEKENRVGWLIKRSSSMTLLKVLIPLSFLFGVVMYSAAMPYQDIGRAAELLTITFLASIALYFSSERPQPLTMTVIDFIFAGFYAITGVVSMSVFILDFFPKVHTLLSGYISLIVPIGIMMIFLYLWRRINSNKYAPKMLSSDEN